MVAVAVTVVAAAVAAAVQLVQLVDGATASKRSYRTAHTAKQDLVHLAPKFGDAAAAAGVGESGDDAAGNGTVAEADAAARAAGELAVPGR